jgi:hypothetical protein
MRILLHVTAPTLLSPVPLSQALNQISSLRLAAQLEGNAVIVEVDEAKSRLLHRACLGTDLLELVERGARGVTRVSSFLQKDDQSVDLELIRPCQLT